MNTYRELKVWQTGIEMVESVYRLTKAFPADERFGLTSQLQRAAVSVPANIAEGWGRSRSGDYLHHLSIAKGSLMEVETHLVIALRLNFTSKEEAKSTWELAQETGKMLSALIASIKKRQGLGIGS
ncbi:MAG TPA: four helix bundle protein [Armatimonadota bacterium]|jgi:four helix bundle protein